ncbi:hypothetical protein MEPL4_4c01500 [Melissococcus plutonius]|nr:hypothetical protein MEPL_c011320 [Melissococcus plutonius S1]KMT25315.1 hypothetical protein MEPL2_2c08790 [Melissococcus plutonius]KMT26220.1 hypothetical protein MEPL3_3c01520 [Melissococcus plutonius]KMT26950.1 hypothetical protein MEPL1_4c01520 [Melissococcus plutonius]KMT28961.1 hypothetical protein MEPL4_4c01500 [Melissococcus plutonius]
MKYVGTFIFIIQKYGAWQSPTYLNEGNKRQMFS